MEYKFNLGDIVHYKGFKNALLFVIQRHQVECCGGKQNYYECRQLTVDRNDKDGLKGLALHKMDLCEIELEKGG